MFFARSYEKQLQEILLCHHMAIALWEVYHIIFQRFISRNGFMGTELKEKNKKIQHGMSTH
jgi:hypothetical protein